MKGNELLIQQHEWISKSIAMKEASQKTTYHILWFHWYEILEKAEVLR